MRPDCVPRCASRWTAINILYREDGGVITACSTASFRSGLQCRLLVDIKVNLIPSYNTSLLWFNDHLFLVSDNAIKQINASAPGSAASELPVPDTKHSSCITLSHHGKLIRAQSTRSKHTFDCTLSRPAHRTWWGGWGIYQTSVSYHCKYRVSLNHAVSVSPSTRYSILQASVSFTRHFL